MIYKAAKKVQYIHIYIYIYNKQEQNQNQTQHHSLKKNKRPKYLNFTNKEVSLYVYFGS